MHMGCPSSPSSCISTSWLSSPWRSWLTPVSPWAGIIAVTLAGESKSLLLGWAHLQWATDCEETGHSHHHRYQLENGKFPDNLRFSSTLTKFNGIAEQGEAERPGRGKGRGKRIYSRPKKTPLLPYFCELSLCLQVIGANRVHFLVSTLLTCATWVNPLPDLLSLAGSPVSPSAMRDQAGVPRPWQQLGSWRSSPPTCPTGEAVGDWELFLMPWRWAVFIKSGTGARLQRHEANLAGVPKAGCAQRQFMGTPRCDSGGQPSSQPPETQLPAASAHGNKYIWR